ncbi:MAG: PAS domain S-box protein [Anaerolineales bacterium]|nr:PAS domain S-box protein [Anaerolineales bacterium]
MPPMTKTEQNLWHENQTLRQQLKEAEAVIQALRLDPAEALVIPGPQGEPVYSLIGAERQYRVFIEAMNEGALTLSSDGVILYGNNRLAELVRLPLEKVIGASIYQFVALGDEAKLRGLLTQSGAEDNRAEISLKAGDGSMVPCYFSIRSLVVDEFKGFCMVVTDLTELVAARLALEHVRQREQQEHEFHRLLKLAGAARSAVTAELFGLAPLRQNLPDMFEQFVKRYAQVLDLALEQRAYKVEHHLSEELQTMAEQLGFVKAGPRDVIEIHSVALTEKSRTSTSLKAQAYLEEGRLLVLELMGYLVSFYRNLAIWVKPGAVSKNAKTHG